MNRTGFICPDGSYIEVPYYEVNEFARKKCHEYMLENEKNNNDFQNFSKRYQTFEPYLDFLLCVLDYIFINPLNYENTIVYFERYALKMKQVESLDKPINKLKEEQNYFTYWMPCSDSALEVQPFSDSIKLEGIIMPNGKFIVLDRDILGVHEILAGQILNQLIIKNKELYQDYLEYIKRQYGGVIAFPMPSEMTSINYIASKLGYIRYARAGNSSTYIYNSLFLTDETQKIIENLQKNAENLGSDILECHNFSEEEIEKSKQFIMQM